MMFLKSVHSERMCCPDYSWTEKDTIKDAKLNIEKLGSDRNR